MTDQSILPFGCALRPLPLTPLLACRELRVPVRRFSTIRVLCNTYSVPSRLIGTTLLVRVRSETLEVYRATAHLLSMPGLLGTGQHRLLRWIQTEHTESHTEWAGRSAPWASHRSGTLGITPTFIQI